LGKIPFTFPNLTSFNFISSAKIFAQNEFGNIVEFGICFLLASTSLKIIDLFLTVPTTELYYQRQLLVKIRVQIEPQFLF